MSQIILDPDKGFLVPVKTTANKTAIVAPVEGSVLYDSDQGALNEYNGSAWKQVLNESSDIPAANLTGTAPASAMPAGSVIQLAQVATTTQVSTAGTDVSIGLSQAITVRANSKVFALANYCWYNDGSAGSWSNAGTGRLFQNGVSVAFTEHNGTVPGEAASWQNTLAYTTAALSAGTYTFEIKHSRTIGGTHVCMRDGRQGTLILMEIAA